MSTNSWTKAFDDFVSATMDAYTKTQFQNNVFDDIPLFNALKANGNYVAADGGNDILVPIMDESNSTAKAYTEYEDLDVTPSNVGTVARFMWARYAVTVAISGDEKDRNVGKHQIINLLQSKMTQAEMSLKDKLNVDLHSTNDGTDGKSLIGLQRMVPVAPATYSVGGIPTSNTNWRSQTNSGGVVFNTSNAGEIAMSAMMNDTTFGSRTPNLILTTTDVHEKYETEIRESGRTMLPAGYGDSGLARLSFRGVPVIWDRDCTSGVMYFLDLNSMKLRYNPRRNFSLTDPKQPANKDATYWQILWAGQLTTEHRRSQGNISSIS